MLAAAFAALFIGLLTENRFSNVSQEVFDPAQQAAASPALLTLATLTAAFASADVDRDTSHVRTGVHPGHHGASEGAKPSRTGAESEALGSVVLG